MNQPTILFDQEKESKTRDRKASVDDSIHDSMDEQVTNNLAQIGDQIVQTEASDLEDSFSQRFKNVPFAGNQVSFGRTQDPMKLKRRQSRKSFKMYASRRTSQLRT